MKWNIVTDSACDLLPAARGEIGFSSVPFVISIGDTDYVDEPGLDVLAMLEHMERSHEPSRSACPSPGAWAEEFVKADNTIAVTISGNLSGSLNSAVTAREMVLAQHPEKNIAVLDSRSTGPEIVMCVERLFEQIASGLSFEQVEANARQHLEDIRCVFILCSFINLVKNGRMTKMSGFLAHTLGMRGIGVASEEGKIAIKGKTRGAARALEMLLDDMRQRGYSGGAVFISHCQNLSLAETLRSRIVELWRDAQVSILPTRGLDSYYAERGGLIVAY